MQISTSGSLIIGWSFGSADNQKDSKVLIVGQKKPNERVEIINAFEGKEAEELYKKLTTVKKKGEKL